MTASEADAGDPAAPGPEGRRAQGRALLRRVAALRGWSAAVAASAAILALAGLALAVDWLATHRSDAATYTAPAPVTRVVLEIASGGVVVRGGNPDRLRVRRVERSSFGRRPRERRSLAGGVLRISSRCPKIVLGGCAADYVVTVPDGVDLSVRTVGGTVRLAGFHGSAQVRTRSGDVEAEAFCGFGLEASSVSGGIRAIAACAPKRLDLRSVRGDVAAVVPTGRYRIAATTDTGRRRVRRVLPTPGARFGIDAHSSSGDVTVEGGL